MAEGWTSDWEKLFAKCVADADYRARLATALENNDDTGARALLDNIGVGGTTDTVRSLRLTALKDLRVPIMDVSSEFHGGQPPMALAP
jgi:hypothetical protein